METLALIRAANGIAFTMRLVRQGDRYGHDNCLTHDKAEPLAEFYDTRHNFDLSPAGTMLGQFTGGRYYVETLLKSDKGGLCLHGGLRDWTLDAEAFALVQSILRNWIGQIAKA